MARKSPKFDDFFVNIYLPHARLRKRSWQLDAKIETKHISPYFGNMQISEIRQTDVEEWLNSLLAHGYAPTSCNRFLAVLKIAFAMAESRGLTAESPCRNTRPFRKSNQSERYLSKKEAGMLMAALAKSEKQEAKAIRLIMLTGARKSEILKARWENVSFERRMLTVPLSKSNRPRHIILSNAALSILQEMRSHKTGQWLFPGRNPDKPLSDIFLFWNGLRKELGLQDVRVHDLRHSFASFLVNAGHSLYEVQKLLGHNDPRTTMRYAHLGQDSLVVAAEVVSEAVSG